MPSYIFAWLAAITSGTVGVLQKLTSKHSIKNPWLMNFFFSLFLYLFVIIIAVINHAGYPKQGIDIFLAALFGQLFWILFFLALYRLDVSALSPLFNIRGIFGVILGVIFLGEVLKMQQILLIATIIISAFFVVMDEKFRLNSFFKPAIGLALAAMFSLALNGFFINKAAIHNTYWQLTLWQAIFSLIIIFVTVPFFIKDLSKTKLNQYIVLFFIAFIQVFYELSANKAFSMNVGISSVIISLPVSMIIAFLFSIFAPKLLEKHTLKIYLIRFVATGVMIFSALQLSH